MRTNPFLLDDPEVVTDTETETDAEFEARVERESYEQEADELYDRYELAVEDGDHDAAAKAIRVYHGFVRLNGPGGREP